MDKVVHFEIPADDMSRVKKFYTDAFGWKLEDVPEMSYVLAHTVDIDEKTMMPKEPGAINGGIAKRGDVLMVPSFSVRVSDIEDAIGKIEKAGGIILQGKTSIGDMGFIAYFKDTEGNVLSLWETM